MKLNMPEPAGYNIIDWCRAVGIGRSKFYYLPPEELPRSVRLGKRTVIILESPHDYLERMAAQQVFAHVKD